MAIERRDSFDGEFDAAVTAARAVQRGHWSAPTRTCPRRSQASSARRGRDPDDLTSEVFVGVSGISAGSTATQRSFDRGCSRSLTYGSPTSAGATLAGPRPSRWPPDPRLPHPTTCTPRSSARLPPSGCAPCATGSHRPSAMCACSETSVIGRLAPSRRCSAAGTPRSRFCSSRRAWPYATRGDRFPDMPSRAQLDAAIEQVLRGDEVGDDVATFARWVNDMRGMGGQPPPPPSPELAGLLAGCAGGHRAPANVALCQGAFAVACRHDRRNQVRGGRAPSGSACASWPARRRLCSRCHHGGRRCGRRDPPRARYSLRATGHRGGHPVRTAGRRHRPLRTP